MDKNCENTQTYKTLKKKRIADRNPRPKQLEKHVTSETKPTKKIELFS